MAKFKKLAMLCTALLATASLSVASGCNFLNNQKDKNSSSESSSVSASSESESESESEESSSLDISTDSESSSEDESSSTESSSKDESSSDDSSSDEGSSNESSSEDESSSDDSSSDEGSSSDSSSDSSDSSSNSSDSSDIGGDVETTGGPYDRIEIGVGTHTVVVPNANTQVFYSVSASETGKYRLKTTAANGISANRYDASAAYFPCTEEDNGTIPYVENEGDTPVYFIPAATATKDGEGFYIEFQFKTEEACLYTPATFGFFLAEGTGTDVSCQITIERIGDADPVETIPVIDVTPENDLTVADDYSATQFKKTAVPYTATIVYSDPAEYGDGYYHLNDEYGPIVHVAITSKAPRLFDTTFADVNRNGGNLKLESKDSQGNTVILNFEDFILNNDSNYAVDEETQEPLFADLSKNVYQNFVNADGLYPVNAELKAFLDLYTQKNLMGDQVPDAAKWLAPCFYYEQNVLAVDDTTTVEIPANTTMEYVIEMGGEYVLTWEDENVVITTNFGTAIVSGEKFEYNRFRSGPIYISTEDGAQATVELELTEWKAPQLSEEEATSVTVEPGDMFTATKYSFTATQTGVYTFTVADSAKITAFSVSGNGFDERIEAVTDEDGNITSYAVGSISVNVMAGTEINIAFFNETTEASTFDVTVAFSLPSFGVGDTISIDYLPAGASVQYNCNLMFGNIVLTWDNENVTIMAGMAPVVSGAKIEYNFRLGSFTITNNSESDLYYVEISCSEWKAPQLSEEEATSVTVEPGDRFTATEYGFTATQTGVYTFTVADSAKITAFAVSGNGFDERIEAVTDEDGNITSYAVGSISVNVMAGTEINIAFFNETTEASTFDVTVAFSLPSFGVGDTISIDYLPAGASVQYDFNAMGGNIVLTWDNENVTIMAGMTPVVSGAKVEYNFRLGAFTITNNSESDLYYVEITCTEWEAPKLNEGSTSVTAAPGAWTTTVYEFIAETEGVYAFTVADSVPLTFFSVNSMQAVTYPDALDCAGTIEIEVTAGAVIEVAFAHAGDADLTFEVMSVKVVAEEDDEYTKNY